MKEDEPSLKLFLGWMLFAIIFFGLLLFYIVGALRSKFPNYYGPKLAPMVDVNYSISGLKQ